MPVAPKTDGNTAVIVWIIPKILSGFGLPNFHVFSPTAQHAQHVLCFSTFFSIVHFPGFPGFFSFFEGMFTGLRAFAPENRRRTRGGLRGLQRPCGEEL